MNPLFSPVKKNLKMWLMDEYIDRLKAVDENIWAHYAFRFERSIPREKIPSYAARARSDIDKLLATQKAATIDTFIKDLGIKTESEDIISLPRQTILARFTSPPDRIILNKKIIDNLARSSSIADIESIILAHEIYHCLESRNKALFSQQCLIEKNGFFSKRKYPCQGLSEYSAMYFSRRINELNYSPFVIDFILLYETDKAEAIKLFNFIIGLS